MKKRLAPALAVVLAAAAAAFLWWPRAPVRSPAEQYAAGDIPVPPMQHAPWSPPGTTIPDVAIDAVRTLFAQGLADPRGCEYREAKLLTDEARRYEAEPRTTHAWVLPAPASDGERFAVCWDGLVHPVLVGGPADLKKDFESSDSGPDSGNFAIDTRTRAALLLRLGEGKLGEALWNTLSMGPSKPRPPSTVWQRWTQDPSARGPDPQDPYLWMAGSLLSDLYGSAGREHLYGDHRLALARLRQLARAHEAIEAEGIRRGFAGDRSFDGGREVLFSFGMLDRLTADQERRLKAPRRRSALWIGLDRFPDSSARVAALIEDLDDVTLADRYDRYELPEAPVVKALLAEGEEAVAPLIACLDRDMRVSRVGTGTLQRDPADWTAAGVEQIAYTLVTRLLGTAGLPGNYQGAPSGDGTPWRRSVAPGIRSYWRRYGSIPADERPYAVLKDDDAAPSLWVEAAAAITRPVNEESFRGVEWQMDWSRRVPLKPGETPALAGEPLRSKRNPTVSELMAWRVRDILSRSGGDGDEGGIEPASSMVTCLAAWDPEAGVEPFRALLARGELEGGSMRWNLLNGCAQTGHDAYLQAYGQWLRNPPEGVGPTVDRLCPLVLFPDRPPMKALAEWLFADPASPIVSESPYRQSQYLEEMLGEPDMLRVEAFRRYVLRGLADHTQAGAMRDKGSESVEMFDSEGETGVTVVRVGRDEADGETVIPFRVCDVFADRLGRLEAMPRFDITWPEPKRDEALPGFAEMVARFGRRYAEGDDDSGFSNPRLDIPPLDHPATPAEVEQGLAAFSLEGQGPVRRVPMPLPVNAFWTTCTEWFWEYHRKDPKTGETRTEIEYDREGRVVQAEEVFRDGRWRRYFGFVGWNGVRTAPAEDVEIDSKYFRIHDESSFWRERTPPPTKLGAVECALAFRGKNGYRTAVRGAEVGEPVVIGVKVRSLPGVDVGVPATWAASGAGGSALLDGARFRLEYAPYPFRPGRVPDAGRIKPELVPWEGIEPKAPATALAPGPTKTLLPGEEHAAGEFTLNGVFNLSRPGVYRLRLVFDPATQGLAGDESAALVFCLLPPEPAAR